MARYPQGLPKKHRKQWDKPYSALARRGPRFNRWLNANGYLTPNFRKAEAACKDGTPVSGQVLKNARRHAWNLERLRHRLGDRAIPITSWYRTVAHNRKVGGAGASKHIQGYATDIPVQFVNKVGRDRFDREANYVFRNGGFGQYPGGARHVDSRGYRSRWTSFTPGR